MPDMISIEELEKRKDAALEMLKNCALCPRECKVDRTIGQEGVCRGGGQAKVYSFAPHHGEEPVLSGEYGSGTIFFSWCHTKCAYCQNYTFSQSGQGKEITNQRLSQ